MNPGKTAKATRSLEKRINLAVPVEAVWKALTDAEELTRWFPLQARVKPGVGGSIWSAWGDEMSGDALIEIWEPNRHLRTQWNTGAEGATAADAKGDSSGRNTPAPTPIAVDFYLEGQGGETVLRLVHSGFSADADWDEYYDGVRRGWEFELRGVKHYLEHHLGTPRRVVWVRRSLAIRHEEAWDRLMSPRGLLQEGRLDRLHEGDRYAIRTATGDAFEGTIQIFSPPKDLAMTVANLNNGLFRLRIDHSCSPGGGQEINLWLSTYGIPPGDADAVEQRWTGLVKALYPEDCRIL